MKSQKKQLRVIIYTRWSMENLSSAYIHVAVLISVPVVRNVDNVRLCVFFFSLLIFLPTPRFPQQSFHKPGVRRGFGVCLGRVGFLTSFAHDSEYMQAELRPSRAKTPRDFARLKARLILNSYFNLQAWLALCVFGKKTGNVSPSLSTWSLFLDHHALPARSRTIYPHIILTTRASLSCNYIYWIIEKNIFINLR